MKDQNNKTLVVTGGTKGIGRAITEAFLQDGFDICTCARNAADLESLKNVLEKKYPGQQVHTMAADLSEKEECLQFGEFAGKMLGHVSVLVNNTGFFVPGQLHDEKDGVLESMISTNLYSAYYMSRQFLADMMKTRSGHIFNICSTASIVPYTNGGSYCISKFALYGMTKVLREEMKEYDVRVTAILPGATLTSSWEGVDLPESRFMKPLDIGQAILGCWKLSDYTVVEELLLRPQLGDI